MDTEKGFDLIEISKKYFKISSRIAPHNFSWSFLCAEKIDIQQVKLCIGLVNINHMWIFWYQRHNNFMKNSPKKKHSRNALKNNFQKILFHFSTFNKFLIFYLIERTRCRYPEIFNFCQFVSIENKIQWLAVDTNSRAIFHLSSSWFYLCKYESKHKSHHRTNGLIAFSFNSSLICWLFNFSFDLCRQTRELCKYLWIISCDDIDMK